MDLLKNYLKKNIPNTNLNNLDNFDVSIKKYLNSYNFE